MKGQTIIKGGENMENRIKNKNELLFEFTATKGMARIFFEIIDELEKNIDENNISIKETKKVMENLKNRMENIKDEIIFLNNFIQKLDERGDIWDELKMD